MNIGDKAPETLGFDENGKEIRLSDYKGKKSCYISIRKTTRQDVLPKHAVCATDMKIYAKPDTKSLVSV